ncbi:hypothetical protein H5410_001156 [Solanum commersonii]|uniref:F-box associated domain-containing protein n=1 Tax=Solanum commersonii TaxID=4109 RepID=A0A9J6AZC0_SOLCO|nr:hypothetical protein H5410_001156 [Solanum commersonii]
MQQGVIPDDILSCTSCDDEILFITNLKSGTLCLCYDVTRYSWRKLEIKGLPMNHCIEGNFSYVERLVMKQSFFSMKVKLFTQLSNRKMEISLPSFFKLRDSLHIFV